MWEMNGYGIYIWPCYSLVLGGMLFLVLGAANQARRLKNQLKSKQLSQTKK